MKNYFYLDTTNFFSNQIQKRFEANEISTDLQEKLEMVMRDAQSFSTEEFEIFDLEEIFIYLKASHAYYLDVWIPKIENSIFQMHDKMSKNYWSIKLLTLFVNSYKQQLIDHIEKEENVLFLFVDNLIKGKFNENHKDIVLNHFIHTHNDNVVIQLDELRNDLLSFDSELEGNLMLEVLFNQLTVFQRDLLVHGLVEDHVFIPKILAFTNANFGG